MMRHLPELLDEAADPCFKRFYAYYCSKAPDGRLPGRQHIDPIEMGEFLAGIVLYDVEDRSGSLRFRLRICGTRFTELMGIDGTGRYSDEVYAPPQRDLIEDALERVVRNRQAHFWEAAVPIPGRDFLRYKRLALPLATDGWHVDMVVCFVVPVSRDPSHA